MCYNSKSISYYFYEIIKTEKTVTKEELLNSFKSMKTVCFNDFEEKKKLREYKSVRS